MGRIWDELKTALGDQVRGSMKYGASTSFGHNRDAMLAARSEREAEEAARRGPFGTPSRENGYFSQDRGYGAADYFIGRHGEITSERPHVHVVHNPKEGKISFTVTQLDGEHTHQEYLPIDASGNEVNAVQDRLRWMLR